MQLRTTILIGFFGLLSACGASDAEYTACLAASTAAWEACADDCDASYPDEDDDAAWEACMNGCDQAAEFAEADCDAL